MRNRKPHWLVRSQQLQLPSLPFRRQFPDKTFKFRFAWSARARAILVASQCIGIHFKGVQPGGDQIGPEGSSGGREIVINDGAEKLRGMGTGKENSRVKWRRVRNSRAVALYDDGSFTRKSQCSATVLAVWRNVHPLTSPVQFSPIAQPEYT